VISEGQVVRLKHIMELSRLYEGQRPLKLLEASRHHSLDAEMTQNRKTV
jgi:hypothetical protein